MMERVLLRRIVRTLVKDGRIEVTDWEGRVWTHEGPNTRSDRPWLKITVHDVEVIRQMAKKPHAASLIFGEAYVSKAITFGEGAGKDGAQLRLFFELLAANASQGKPQPVRRKSNKKEDQRENIAAHYDVNRKVAIGGDELTPVQRFYELELGRTMIYSCAYRANKSMTLDEAQDAKVNHLLNKLDLRPGMTLLDVGCGSGYLAVMAAKRGVKVMGITISWAQLDYARRLAEREGVQHLVRFEHMNYQELPDKLAGVRYDRIVSVGMFEHVGLEDYELFFGIMSEMLVPGGVFVLHTITQRTSRPISPFVDEHIFPGGYLPTLEEVGNAVKPTDFEQGHVENLYAHYAWTLNEWATRHLEHRGKIEELLGEKFWLERWLWLWGSWAGFLFGELGLNQFIYHKGKSAEPVTYGHIYRESAP